MQCRARNKRGGRCGCAARPGFVTCDNYAHAAQDRELRAEYAGLEGESENTAGPFAPPSPSLPAPEAEESAEMADIPTFDPMASEPAATPPPPAQAWDVPDVPEAPEGGELDDGVAFFGADPFAGAGALPELEPERGGAAAAPLPAGAWAATARLGWQIVGARLESAGASALERDELDALAEAWGSALAYQFRHVDPNNPWGAAMMTAGMVLLPRVLEVRAARAKPKPKPKPSASEPAGAPPPAPSPSSIMSQLGVAG